MARDLLAALQLAEDKWRKASPEWNQKLHEWENWKIRAKERERLAERAKKQKKDPDAPGATNPQESSWEKSFDPDDPSPQFSFAGSHTFYSKSELDDDIDNLQWAMEKQQWAFECLRRGIAVHHSGMNKQYQTLVERWEFQARF